MMNIAIRRALQFVSAVLIAAAAAGLHAETLDLAWWKEGKLQAQQLHEDGSSMPAEFDGKRIVPLGSLWKLFVYIYAVEKNVPLPDYTCSGHLPDEVYCCEAGASIARDAALAQSCGLFFQPARLMLASIPWRDYWTAKLGGTPSGEFDWLSDPVQLKPERLVSLQSLLRVLASLPTASREAAESALLHVVLNGKGAETVRWFGSRLRVKTFSWHQPDKPDQRMGGAAGWLADGTPVWFAGNGTSSAILQHWAPMLANVLPTADSGADAGCVVVDYFARYPIRNVRDLDSGNQADIGVLNGRYRVQFDNGNKLEFSALGEMSLWLDANHSNKPRLRGRLTINEYVARVLDREADARQLEAAKALAIAVRTYLQQNAELSEGCQRIADSSRTQRVSASPASEVARSVARWTDQLILNGVTVRYHADQPSANTLAWREAEAQAKNNKWFDEILSVAYPGADLTTLNSSTGVSCILLPSAQNWLKREMPGWERKLSAEPGYERPQALPLVCQLNSGSPYSEQSRNRIFIRGLMTRDDRITLAHEFLHLGFRNHPRGQDEEFVEQLAQRLVDNRLTENFR